MAAKKNNNNNPTPDEIDKLFSSFLSNSFMELNNPTTQSKPSVSERDMDMAACETKKVFDAYVRAGFTEAQAIALIGNIITGNQGN